jgi:oligopeptide/dipeptide ABC transporter ATP-binding protein
MAGASLMEVQDLTVSFGGTDGDHAVVRGVSFTVGAAERVGLVGESGSGKSLTARAMMQLVPAPGAVSGRILLEGTELGTGARRDPTGWRGSAVAMITQDPLSSLNPLVRIGKQMTEMLRFHRRFGRAAARARARELLIAVGIPDPDRTLSQFPAVLSGGMRQRVALAIAVSCDPQLLIADEPTTALDVTIQAQVLGVLKKMTAEQGSSVLLISHDLGVVAGFCERLIVMYAGQIVESGPTERLIARPAHPYTRALLASVPPISGDLPARLPSIPGSPPAAGTHIVGCPFAPRCPIARDVCRSVDPPLGRQEVDGHLAACHATADAAWFAEGAGAMREVAS